LLKNSIFNRLFKNSEVQGAEWGIHRSIPIDEARSATSPEGDKQQMGVFQQPVGEESGGGNHPAPDFYSDLLTGNRFDGDPVTEAGGKVEDCLFRRPACFSVEDHTGFLKFVSSSVCGSERPAQRPRNRLPPLHGDFIRLRFFTHAFLSLPFPAIVSCGPSPDLT